MRNLFCNIKNNILCLLNFFFKFVWANMFEIMVIRRMIGDFMAFVYFRESRFGDTSARAGLVQKTLLWIVLFKDIEHLGRIDRIWPIVKRGASVTSF